MWIDESKRRIFLDMHFPDWPERQSATGFQPEKIAETFEQANVDSVILYAKCQFGNFYYDTAVGHKHSGLGNLDFFRKTEQLLHEKNIKVIAYYSVAWDELYAAEHPEWRVEQADGTKCTDEFRWSTLCVNSPYRNVVISHLQEIARDLKPDGFWIDMTIIGRDCCYCRDCRAKYESTYGEELVPAASKESPEYSRFVQFRYHYIEEFYQEIYESIREILPEAQITNNYWGYPYSNDTMGSRAIGALKQADYVTGEAYTDWTGLSAPGFFTKWLRSAAGGKAYEALIGRFTGTWDYTVKPPVQLALEAYTVAANGATVTIDDEPFADGSLDWEMYRSIGEIFGKIREREPYLGGEPLLDGAIFHSQVTKDYFFHGEAPFIATVTGAYRLMKELQSSMGFLFDENLTAEELGKYKFILLPSAAVVSPEQMELLLDYARNGGLIIAAGETALYSLGNGRMERCDIWEKALGIEYQGTSDYTLSYYHLNDSPYAENIPQRPVTVRGSYLKYQCNAGEPLAYVVDPICETSKTTFFHNNLPAPYENTSYPALWHREFGKGSILLFSQNVFAQFGRYHQLEIKKLFRNILKIHNCEAQVRYHCSSNVETSAWFNDGRMVLHLVNFNPGMTLCTGTMDTFEAQYPRTFEFVEETQAIHNLKIEIFGLDVVSAKELEYGHNLTVTSIQGGVSLTLPSLEQWETIVVELIQAGGV